MTEQETKEREDFTFKDKAVQDLKNLYGIENAEELVENPRKYAEIINKKRNYYRALLQYLEMWTVQAEKEIEDVKIQEMPCRNGGPEYGKATQNPGKKLNLYL